MTRLLRQQPSFVVGIVTSQWKNRTSRHRLDSLRHLRNILLVDFGDVHTREQSHVDVPTAVIPSYAAIVVFIGVARIGRIRMIDLTVIIVRGIVHDVVAHHDSDAILIFVLAPLPSLPTVGPFFFHIFVHVIPYHQSGSWDVVVL